MSVILSPKDAQSSMEIEKPKTEDFAKVVEPKTCAICLIHFKPTDSLKKLECSHEFHEACIDEWLTVRGNCPFCRHIIDASVAENGSSIDDTASTSSNDSSIILPADMDDLDNMAEDGFIYPDYHAYDSDQEESIESLLTSSPIEYFDDYGTVSEDSCG